MNHHGMPVVASANSRLHADVILVRLRRAQIDTRKISVFYHHHAMPNAVGCWLPVMPDSELRLDGEAIGRAGHLVKAAMPAPHEDGREIVQLLTRSGVDLMGAHILSERLGQGHILICVQAADEDEAAIAWHVFRHSQADTIVTGSDTTASGRAAREIHQIAPWVPAAA